MVGYEPESPAGKRRGSTDVPLVPCVGRQPKHLPSARDGAPQWQKMWVTQGLAPSASKVDGSAVSGYDPRLATLTTIFQPPSQLKMQHDVDGRRFAEPRCCRVDLAIASADSFFAVASWASSCCSGVA